MNPAHSVPTWQKFKNILISLFHLEYIFEDWHNNYTFTV
uniref:Uncharacterized protein n=1 Tax=Anguilla anguilla TaxID=7936 RepID=A0A0E9TKJ9_ANGAN